MPSGLISQNDLAANTWVQIAPSPSAGKIQVLTTSIAARSQSTTFRLAVSNTGTTTPGNTDFIEYNSTISGVLERSGIVLNSGQILLAYSQSAGLSVSVYGAEATSGANSGVQDKVELAGNTYTQVTAAPGTGRGKAVTVNFCNKSTSNVSIRLAIAANTSNPTNSEFIEYETVLGGYGILERTGIYISGNTGISAYANAASVSVVSYGLDEAI